jgi:prepilin-type N-terminal cleavage/methylation domain-containing protein
VYKKKLAAKIREGDGASMPQEGTHMKAMLKEKLRKKMANSEGFTLLEILVVLTIMGFLIAMVAPRLAGISGSAVDTVCDSNQSRQTSMMSGFFEQTNRFPNNMINIVAEDTTATPPYTLPTVSNDDPDDGAETLSSELQDRNKLAIHILNAAEAAELRNMGITNVVNLNSYDKTAILPAGQAAANNRISVGADVGVAMIGMGAPAAGDDLVIDATGNYERGWNQADWFGRIVLGFGPENGLITSGIVANAAHCPGGIQNADNVTYNEYNLVLPRLEATVDRFGIDESAGSHQISGLNAAVGMADGEINITAVAYDSLDAAAYAIGTNDDNLKIRIFNIAEVQERWQFATMCPEGHKFPAESTEFWAVDLAGTTGTIEVLVP